MARPSAAVRVDPARAVVGPVVADRQPVPAAVVVRAAVGIAVCAVLGHLLGAGAAGALAACALAAAIAAVVARFSPGDGARRGIGTSGVLLGAMALAFAPMLG